MMKRFRPYAEFFKSHHCTIEDIKVTGSNHFKIAIEKEGNRRFFIAAFSPSDRCGFKNFEGDVKRWLRTVKSQRATNE